MMLMSFCSKRNSKLESHLKRTLPRHVYEDIRYYESCIVKQPKEGATFMYVILTGKAILLAAYPFRGVKEAVSLRDIVGINVELDIPPFLKESEGHSCQHIRVSYRNSSLQSHILNLKIVKEEQEEVEQSSINNGSDSSIRERSVESDSQDEVSSFTQNINTDEESEVTKSDAKNKSRTDTSPKTTNAFSKNKKQGHWDDSSSKSSSSTKDLSEDKFKEHIYGSRLTADVPEHKRDTTGFADQTNYPVHKLPEYRSVTRSSTVTPELRRSISSLLRRVQYSQPRPPRSYSSMANYATSASPTLVASAEKRSQSVLERPRSNSDAKRHDWRILDSSSPLDDLHIYVLQAKPVLLNHLQYGWCAYLFDETLSISKTKHYANEICDTFLLENLYQQIKNEIMNQENSLENMYSLLHELEMGLQGRSQLKYIFWKDQMLYHFIVQKLEMYIISSRFKHTIRGNQELETDIYIEGRQDELEIAIAMLDILSTVLHDTDNIHDKIKMLNFRNGSLIQHLLSIITISPRISPKFYNTCCRMLEDFNEFSTYAWRNLPEGGLISLSGTITNKVCGIISELLSTIEKLAETNKNISVSMMFKDIYMENYLRRSITQLLGLLFPVEEKTVEPEESIIVYQHFFVLKYLMVNLPQVTDYIKEHYQEELRFYIHWSRVNAKMPEKYPIKRILRPLVEHIHTIGSGFENGKVQNMRFALLPFHFMRQEFGKRRSWVYSYISPDGLFEISGLNGQNKTMKMVK